MTQQKSLQMWTIVVLLGLFYISIQCDARAVNVSNTWTMPQEGLNVFYRFFRDRISWFEADAVCQFHHANLVTVDNSFQFDATRDLLRELDVNDIVWIGLMRPQNSERFMWSNSRPLVTDTGYWAEALPLMDAPLCAVIDPIRDYRWHALRCGGPETASFLCEMPVPSWADACILKDMPNLTMQYMADTASIELIRNCEEEGLLRQTCKGKQDRERAIRELICPRERLEAQRINDITNSHFKSLQIINSIRTDNNENNDIELMPLGQSFETISSSNHNKNNNDFNSQLSTEKNPVQRLIEQFNVDELMQADESPKTNGFHIPGEIPKPVKKSAKKVIIPGEYSKKIEKPQKVLHYEQPKAKKPQQLALEDMMMGDQPIGEPEVVENVQSDEVSNEIMEPLPHMKKILPQDLKTMPTIMDKTTQVSEKSSEPKAKSSEEEKSSEEDLKLSVTTEFAGSSTTTTTTTTTAPLSTVNNVPIATTITTNVGATVISVEEATDIELGSGVAETTQSNLNNTEHINTPTSSAPAATIGHPMHPQQPRSNVITEETQHQHIKESADNSHFIPPMLLVKSHYVPPLKHGEHHEHGEHLPEHHGEHEGGNNMASATTSTTTTTIANISTSIMTTTISAAETPVNKLTTLGGETAIDESDELTRTTERNGILIDANAEATMNSNSDSVEDENKNKKVKDVVNVLDGISTTTTTTTTAPITTIAEAAKVSISLELLSHKTTPSTQDIISTTKSPTTTTTIQESLPELATTTEKQPATVKPEVERIQTETSGRQHDKPETIVMTTDAPATVTTTTTTTTTTSAPMTTTPAVAATTTATTQKSSPTSSINSTPTITTTNAPIASTTTTTAATASQAHIASETSTTTTTTTTTTTAATQSAETTTITTAAAATASANPTSTTANAHVSSHDETYIDSADNDNNDHDHDDDDDDEDDDDGDHDTSSDTNLHTNKRNYNNHHHHRKHHEHHGDNKHHEHEHEHEHELPEPTPTRNFLNEETEAPFKPNRRRALTKPETVSYFKKILG